MNLSNHRLAPLMFVALLPACARAQDGGSSPATWAFEYPKNSLASGAALDLRYLNEKEAGESGFVRLSPDGNSFVLGSGKPVRFWAVGSDLYRAAPDDIVQHVKFLAKVGVNMVRLHTQIPGGEGSKITDVNQKEIDGIWRFVAAAKKQGIYTTISPYWAAGKNAANWGIAGYEGNTGLWGLLMFNEKLQQGYKAWIKALYAPVNPYTGIPLAKDPAVGIIQIQNEDSLLFWTTQGMKPEQQAVLARKFAAWLTKKYGSLSAARQAWEGAGSEKDDPVNGKVGLMLVWPMTQQLTGGMAKRVNDETQFYAETQRGFYADIVDYLRNALGCKQLINCSNWITADPIKLNDVERWTYTAADVEAVNRYYDGGVHIGENNGWRIDPGHHFTNESVLLDPRSLPTNLKQVVGHPMIITESSWVSPLGYQSEGPFLVAAYESLTGVDAYYWFSATDPEYDLNPYFTFLNFAGGQHALHKWTCSTPSLIGQFPANALIYRMGYIKQGEPVVHEERPLASLWHRDVPIIAEDKSFDPNRNTGDKGEQSNIQNGIDPLAFLVGPVEVKYGGASAGSHVADLGQYIDRSNKRITSETSELRWDYGKGFCTLNAPKAQGATGFLSKAGEIKLGDVTIRCGNDYATVEAVSMDGLPMSASKRILVQVGTVVRPTGWKTREAQFTGEDKKTTYQGYEIENTGTMPWQVVNTDVTLTARNPGLRKATLLDTAGFVTGTIPVTVTAGRFTVKLPPNAMYVVLE